MTYYYAKTIAPYKAASVQTLYDDGRGHGVTRPRQSYEPRHALTYQNRYLVAIDTEREEHLQQAE